MKLSKKRMNYVVIGLVIFAAIGSAWYYFQKSATEVIAETPELQIAKVRTGDLIITASGAGTVLPASELDLGFRTSGVLAELNVAVGDSVESDEVLARLEANVQAEAEFEALFSSEGIAKAELALITAQDDLAAAESNLSYLFGADAWYWRVQMENTDLSQSDRDTAQANFDYFVSLQTMDASDLAKAEADLEIARVNLQDAQAALDIVKAGPSALNAPIAALGEQMAKLEQARLAVENTRLVAPFNGTVTQMNAINGQAVGTSPIMTIATTETLLVRFYLDETDLDKATVGNRVDFIFDTYPDQPVQGKVLVVEPSLQVVDGTPVVVVWASLPNDSGLKLMAGMTVDVEVIAGESLKTLIVPVQALRELAPGSYAVFLVDTDGQLILTSVSVGLRDFANAEILSGVKVGDTVSTGTVETKD